MTLFSTHRAIACSALISAFAISFTGSSAHAGWLPFAGEKAEKPAAAKAAPAQHVDAVFLHGLGGSPNGMPLPGLESALSKLGVALKIASPWLRPVKIDAEGYTRSAGPHTMTDQLARARAEIEKHEGPVVLIGHSFGGKAALALAKQMPGKVKGIIAVAPSVKMLYAYWKDITGERGLPENRETVVARLADHEKMLRGELAKVEADSARAGDLRGHLNYLKTMQDLALHDETKMELDVAVPTLMLHGENDGAVSIHYARRFAEANPKVKLVEYKGIGHGMDAESANLPYEEREKITKAARAKINADAHRDMVQRIHGFLGELEAKP